MIIMYNDYLTPNKIGLCDLVEDEKSRDAKYFCLYWNFKRNRAGRTYVSASSKDFKILAPSELTWW